MSGPFKIGDVVIIDDKPWPLAGIVMGSSGYSCRLWLHVRFIRNGWMFDRVVICDPNSISLHPDPDRIHAEHAAWILVNGAPK